MRNMVDEAEKTLLSQNSWKYDKEAVYKIREEINEGLEDAVKLSRKIQAESELVASMFFLY